MTNSQKLTKTKKSDIPSCFCKTMRLPRYGYTIEERKKVIDCDNAYKVLTPALRRKCTKAVRCEDTIGEFVCQKCSDVLPLSQGFIDASFTVKNREIKISQRLDLKELLAIRWLPNQLCITGFELYETITFNLKKGRTFVALEDESGKKIQVYDISNIKVNCYSDDPIFALINLYKPINRELKRQFINFSHSPLPFRTNELTVERFVLMTKFIGYDAAFFNALPYAENELLIEKRFLKTAKRLHYAQNAPNIFEKTALPQVKSTRKVIFCNPALLFYKTELEQVWRLLEDVDLFRRFIALKDIFTELRELCKMPRLIDFYTEFKAALGIKGLCKIMIDGNLNRNKRYIAWYFMLSEYDKKAERQKWHNDSRAITIEFLRNDRHAMGADFSIPMPEWSSELSGCSALECCIQGYSFRRLRNSAEQLQAGKELPYWYSKWAWVYKDVYGIMQNNKYVAAVEVENHKIIQVRTYCNEDISEDVSLKMAYDVWKNRNGLHED